MKILITGGAGFIGSRLISYLIHHTNYQVINIDALTYAGNLLRLKDVEHHPRYKFYHVNIADFSQVNNILITEKPCAVINLAAETHVDNSINNAANFIHSNIVGTYSLLENIRIYWQQLANDLQQNFKFIQVSTDEIYGSLSVNSATEATQYAPNSPYAASKASSNHLVRAWNKTYQIPTITTNCTNNYGKFQHQEKFIPKIIYNALHNLPIPIYGDGLQIRNWLYVDDHVNALILVLKNGKIGESYNISAQHQTEITNLKLAHTICDLLDELAPAKQKYANLITHVTDRSGHDYRYAIDSSKIQNELNFCAQTNLQEGLKLTLNWYLSNLDWYK